MIETNITRSSFRSVYLSIAFIMLSVVCGIFASSRFLIAPKIAEERAGSVFSIIRSHQYNILLNKTRPLRDELIKQGIISSDLAFQHYPAQDAEGKARITEFLRNCVFYSPNICLSHEESLFLAGNKSPPSQVEYQFAIFLKTNLRKPPLFFSIVESLTLCLICLGFAFLVYSINRKEQLLLEKLSLVAGSFDRVRLLFSTPSQEGDEFEVMSKNIDQLASSLEEKTRKIGEYKESFERKTKLEQLGLTVGQVSHDLKAPLNEAKNFIDALPLLMERVPKDELQKSLSSLSKRLGSGVDALDQALRFTQVVAIPKENIFLLELIDDVIARARLNPKMKEINITVDSGKFEEFIIRGERSEIETVIFNLIQNSWEERTDSVIRITPEECGANHIKLVYRDNGSGIPDALLEKVFEPLVTYKNNGTGIGLYSCREILFRHSGTIRANSSRLGAEFELVIPYQMKNEEAPLDV